MFSVGKASVGQLQAMSAPLPDIAHKPARRILHLNAQLSVQS